MGTRDQFVSVVIPVFNAQAFLKDAIASVLEQSFRNIEVICVNDGSTDGTSEILQWFREKDSRIRVIHQANSGIVEALNNGCMAARGSWICRMDADDLAFPNRLSRQLGYVEELESRRIPVVALGTSILEIDERSRPIGAQSLPTDHDVIVRRLEEGRPGLFHPTALIRRSAFEEVGGYRREYQWIEDHDLWMRLAQHGRLANLQEPLLCYRLHGSSVCWQRKEQQRWLMDQLIKSKPYTRRTDPTKSGRDVQPRLGVHRGKWVRAALKGGYPRTAWLQFWQLVREQRLNGYILRVALEASLRLLPCLIRRTHRPSVTVPDFSHWQPQGAIEDDRTGEAGKKSKHHRRIA